MMVLAYLLAALLLIWIAILLAFSGPLVARWREPMLRKPVLIIESDDWGAGPLEQAEALNQLRLLLQRIRDLSGHPAVMTLGVVFEVPDGARIAANNVTEYYALTLDDARFESIRTAMRRGIDADVFVPQLHGQCHYWPAAIMQAAHTDTQVLAWLTAPDPAATEHLPSALQSRWIDGTSLPSNDLTQIAIQTGVERELVSYRTMMGESPHIAVATTFIWNDAVEAAWAQGGIEAVITPGRRATCRNILGEPSCEDATMLSGEQSRFGLMYLVRDVYFEPSLGHSATQLTEGLLTKWRQRRACLVETHRFNFLQRQDESLAALEHALDAALKVCPDLRFISSLELSRVLRLRDPAWVETRFRSRLAAWYARLDEIPHFRRLTGLSGMGWPLAWLGKVG